jgi:hypothetical protein
MLVDVYRERVITHSTLKGGEIERLGFVSDMNFYSQTNYAKKEKKL